ncbi:MAG: hypothetical protein UU93_C0001G0071 [Candidatus Amesbacteria bacterium GW2011_GWA2_42_12]|uniref:Probable lipid II flippase MurJ n=1 Tax=Candidatus Amesbacteria bacterium GW2011_GWA2_42_12 TaxID=1618356 RepID=A0A0G0Y957_9BACT|nr:MAG: hypothetical protein UU93_C0001G0071 [Candidatus Amesbacteria bacterium GW2011_GWA2_42_12]
MRDIFFRRQTNILSAAFVIMVTYGLSHFIGLFKTRMLISQFFGSGAQLLDVYYAALVIPDTIFQLLIIGALSAAFIPIFTKNLTQSKEKAWHMTASVMNCIFIVFLIVSGVVFFLAPSLARLIGPGFSGSQLATMVSLLRIMLVAQMFFSVSGFLTSIIQSHQRFLIPAMAPIVYNLGIILGIVFLSKYVGIFGPAIGMVIGAALHMLIQIPLAYKLGFRFKLILDFKDSGVREVLSLIPPRSLALGIDQIEQFVATMLASLLIPGSLSLFNVAKLLYAVPTLLFGATIGQAALPTLSQISALKDRVEFIRTLVNSFLQVSFLALPASMILIVLRVPIVRIVFGAKTFPWSATILTGQTLAVLAVSASFYAVMQLIVRGFYALHDTKTPLVVGLFSAIFNAVTGYFYVTAFNMGILGIALAISSTAIIETTIMTYLLLRKLDKLPEIAAGFKSLLRMIFVSFVTGVCLWVPMRLLDQFIFDTTRTLPLVALTMITSLIGLAVYLGLSKLMRISQLGTFVALINRVKDWRRIINSNPPSEALIIPASDQN